MSHQDIELTSSALQNDLTLSNLYRITCNHGDEIGTMWVENGTVHTLTYTEMAKQADAYTAYFQKTLPQDGYVAVMMDTRREWFATFWGLIRSGHNVMMLDASMNDTLCQHLLDEAGCRILLCEHPRSLPQDYLQFSTADLFSCPIDTKPNNQPYGNAVALCTSGTTGTSRIFVYDGTALCNQVLASVLVYQENHRLIDNRNIRCMAFLPFHHVLGFVANLLWCSFLGYATIYLKDRTPKTILETAKLCKPNMLITVPLLCNNLCKGLRKQVEEQPLLKRIAFKLMTGFSLLLQRIAPDAGCRFAEKKLFAGILENLLGTELDALVIGGGSTPAENLRLLNALGYFCSNGFGMTETAITSMETSMLLKNRLKGSVGHPLSNVEYKARNVVNGVGEMMIRSDCLHTGRLEGGRMVPSESEDGWFPTGDLVRIAKDGRVFIVGRCKDVIINESGENVYPDELESMLHLPEGVEQFTVLGIHKENTAYDDITLAAYVGSKTDNAELRERVAAEVVAANAKLPAMKRLTRAILSSEPLPMASGIKVKRAELKQRIENHELTLYEIDLHNAQLSKQISTTQQQEMPAEVDEDLLNTVRGFFAEALQIPESEIDDDAHVIDDLGGDSLQLLSITLSVEEKWNVTIVPDDYGRCVTVRQLAAYISEKLNGTAAEQAHAESTPIKPITCFEDTPEYRIFKTRHDELMAQGEDNPYFVAYDSPLLDQSDMEGKQVLNFGSYNYVGMSGRPEVNEAAKAAIDKYGTSASGSRLLAGEKTLHKQLEAEIANWKHTEDAIVCVGGHSTNVTFVGNFCGKNDLIVYDALAHNSIEQGCRLSDATARPFPHNNAAALDSILSTQRSHFEKVLIVIEGAYSMDGDIADVPAFVAVKKKYGCFLMVDEAHSACVIGESGGGVDEYFHLGSDDIDIKMGTLSKGLGTCGGYLAGKHCLIDYLRYNMPGFVFSVGMSPALAAGSLAALRVLRSTPSIMADLRRNIACFAEEAAKRNLDICLAGKTAVLPVLIGSDEAACILSNALRRKGICVPPAMYPAVPKNKARLRFCVISEHKPEQIIHALDTLVETAAELGISLPKAKT